MLRSRDYAEIRRALRTLALLGATALPAFAQFPDAPRAPLPPLPERRAAVLKAYDHDGNGRLDESEREEARKAWARSQLSRTGDRGFFGPPPELLEEFDGNKDGDLDPDEARTAFETLGRRLEQVRKDYDRDADGRLDENEIQSALKDIDAGKLKGIPRMILQFAGDPPRRGRGPGGPGRPGGPGGPPRVGPFGGPEPDDSLTEADRNHDGRLDADELEALRAERARRRPPTSPSAPRPQP